MIGEESSTNDAIGKSRASPSAVNPGGDGSGGGTSEISVVQSKTRKPKDTELRLRLEKKARERAAAKEEYRARKKAKLGENPTVGASSGQCDGRKGEGKSTSEGNETIPPVSKSSEKIKQPTRQAKEVFNAALLPPRLFCTDRYPKYTRINSYSRPQYLLDLVQVLDGSRELAWLKQSCFGRLFDLPARKSSFSGKLVHQFLCRSLVSQKKEELWFVFGGQPIRFSLREFARITGLNCGPYPCEETLDYMNNPPEPEGTSPPVDEGENPRDAEADNSRPPYFKTLIGPKKAYTIKAIVDMLKLDKLLPEEERMGYERRLRLALLVIVDGILVCDTSIVKATYKVVGMLKNLDTFVKYPWGRKSFSKTLEMVKVGVGQVESVEKLVERLSQSHAATHGFTLAIQLFILEAVPMLEKYMPDPKDERTLSDRSVLELTFLKCFHNSNIIETEEDPRVESIINGDEDGDLEDYSWGQDETRDDGVEFMSKMIKQGHKFKKEDWHGGVGHLPLITESLRTKAEKRTAKQKGKAKCKPKMKTKPQGEAESDGGQGRKIPVDNLTAEYIFREVERRNNEHSLKVQQMILFDRKTMKDEVVDAVVGAVFKCLREKGVFGSNVNYTELLNEINRSPWFAGGGSSHVPNFGGGGSRNVPNFGGGCYNAGPSFAGGPSYEVPNFAGEGSKQAWNTDGVHDIVNNINSTFREMAGGEKVEKVVEEKEEKFVEELSSADESESCTESSDESDSQKEPVDIDSDEEDEDDEDGDADCGQEDGEEDDDDGGGDEDGLEDGKEVVGDAGDADVAKSDKEEEKKEMLNEEEANDMVEEAVLTEEKEDEEPKDKVEDAEGGKEREEEKDRSEDVDSHNGDGHSSDKSGQISEDGGQVKDVDMVDALGAGGHEKQEIPPKRIDGQNDDVLPSSTEEAKQEGTSKKYKRVRFAGDDVTPIIEVPAKRVSKKTKRFVEGSSSTKGKAPADEAASVVEALIPFRPVNAALKAKFLRKLSLSKRRVFVIEGHRMKFDFFEKIYEPQKWVDSPHMEAMLSLLLKRYGEHFISSRVGVLDTWFSQAVVDDFTITQKQKKKKGGKKQKEPFQWNKLIKNYVRGIVPNRSSKMAWYTDIDTVYVPMNWGKRHWVGVVIQLQLGKVLIMDPLISHTDEKKLPRLLKPLLELLPLIIREFADIEGLDCTLPETFCYERMVNVHQNERTGDCGPLTVKFIELHAQGMELDDLTDAKVDEMRMRFAIDIYEEFVGSV